MTDRDERRIVPGVYPGERFRQDLKKAVVAKHTQQVRPDLPGDAGSRDNDGDQGVHVRTATVAGVTVRVADLEPISDPQLVAAAARLAEIADRARNATADGA